MAQKRRISIRKVIQTLVTIIVTTGCVMAISAADRKQSSKAITGVSIRITNGNSDKGFVTEQQLRNALFTARHINPVGMPAAGLDTRSMEKILSSSPWISSAQVFVDNRRVLQIKVQQRTPVIRIFETTGNSYYLDTALQSMPLSTEYTSYLPVVTGVPVLKNDSAGRSIKGTILSLTNRISRSKFWSAQIAQLNMQEDGTFEAVPVLGRQKILLGDTARLEEKLSTLFAFYDKVLNKIGWDNYDTLDVRFKGQVIAKPALRWKAPRDNAMSNMSWVKAILENAPQENPDIPDSLKTPSRTLQNKPEAERKAASAAKPAAGKAQPENAAAKKTATAKKTAEQKNTAAAKPKTTTKPAATKPKPQPQH